MAARTVVTEGYVWQVNAGGLPSFQINLTPGGKVRVEAVVEASNKEGAICALELTPSVANGLALSLQRAAQHAPKRIRNRKPKTDSPEEAKHDTQAGSE